MIGIEFLGDWVRGQGAVLAGHCLGDGEGWAQWGEGLHLGLIVGGKWRRLLAVVKLVRIGNVEDLSELGMETDLEAVACRRGWRTPRR